MLQDTTTIVTHRGLEPSNPTFFPESSLQAFKDHLERGFGLEFDFNITADKQIIIFHDRTLERITGGSDSRAVQSINSTELKEVLRPHGTVCFFDDLIPLLEKSPAAYHAFHIKAAYQTRDNVALIAEQLASNQYLLNHILLFDITIQSAQLFKKINSKLLLAPSVAHPYDRLRYNSAVGGTLLSLEKVIENKALFSGVWLDEWDRLEDNGEQKKFYSVETFKALRDIGFLIGLVTPELHGTSPGLLGGEAHSDSRTQDILFERIAEILSLEPDIICTDYPEEVRALVHHS